MADRGERVPALLVIGAPGSGKTALIKEISECLYRTGDHHDFLASIAATVAAEIAALAIEGPTLVNEPPTTIEALAAQLLTIAGWPGTPV